MFGGRFGGSLSLSLSFGCWKCLDGVVVVDFEIVGEGIGVVLVLWVMSLWLCFFFLIVIGFVLNLIVRFDSYCF